MTALLAKYLVPICPNRTIRWSSFFVKNKKDRRNENLICPPKVDTCKSKTTLGWMRLNRKHTAEEYTFSYIWKKEPV